jgi:hypothetical protein
MHTGLHAVNGLIFALWFVPLYNDRWNVTAGLGMAVLRWHSLS